MPARTAPTARALGLLAALSLAACQAPGSGGSTKHPAKSGAADAAPPPVASTTPVPPPPPPPAPPPQRTSDRGDRLARPSPIGQLAPEETPSAPSPPPSPIPAQGR